MNRRTVLNSFATAAIGSAIGCSAPRQTQSTPGEDGIKDGGVRMIPIEGGKYRVWTRRVGQSDKKLLALHGGPGFNHLYLASLEDFLPQAGIELYFYDQLGCLFSDNPDDEKLWTIERYTDEVEQVRQALGLDNFFLYGHSWGGMLAYEYALKYPQHLRGLIISSMVASIPRYQAYVAKFRNELTPDEAKTLEKYEAANNYGAPEYQKIVFDRIYSKHLCRLSPWPPTVELSLRFANTKIYNYLQGPNEFIITGTMKNWDRTADLKKISTRAIVMGARYDEMDPDEMRRIASAMPNARAAISDKGSHLSMYDDQAWYFGELTSFLKHA